MLYPAELRAHGGELHENAVPDVVPCPWKFAKGRFLVSHLVSRVGLRRPSARGGKLSAKSIGNAVFCLRSCLEAAKKAKLIPHTPSSRPTTSQAEPLQGRALVVAEEAAPQDQCQVKAARLHDPEAQRREGSACV